MARTMTPYERQTVAGSRVGHFARLEVKDADGAWKDMSALLSKDFLIGATLSEHRDQAVGTASFRLRRRDGTASLSPLMSGSLANRNALAAYAPLLDIGREARWTTAATRDVLPPGTNLLKWSEDFTNAAWAVDNGAVTPAAATAPDGTATALRITDNATNGAHGVRQLSGVAIADNAAVVASFFVKAETITKGTVGIIKKDGSDARVWFDLTGATAPTTLGTGITGFGVVPAPNGYLRIWMTVSSVLTGASTPSAYLRTALTMAANGYVGTGQSLLAWGGALDLGSALTDYVKTQGTAGLTTWRERFYGRVDTVSWENDPVVVDCSTLDGWLADTQIEIDAQQYGTTPVGTALQTVVQNIINTWHSGKLTAAQETLYTPTSPAYLVTDWAQGRVKVLDGVRNIAQQATGWDVRFRHDAAHVSRLTLLDPQRARATVDDTIGPTEYLDVTRMSVALGDIRNVVKVFYNDANGAQQFVTSSNAASIAAYGRRYAEVGVSSVLKTAAQAQVVADAIVNDLGFAGVDFSLTLLDHWGVQLYDRHTITQNGEHFDTDQVLAVVGFSVEWADGSATGIMTLLYAGRIIGAYTDWLKIVVPAVAVGTVAPYLMPSPSENGVQGTLKLGLVDPQLRMRFVEYAVVLANVVAPDISAAKGAGGWLAAPAAVGNIITLPSFTLVDKQSYRVVYRLWADIGNGLQVVDNDMVRFALGATPDQPLISPSIFNDGTLTLLVRGDSDTTQVRICVKYTAPPTEAEIDAQPALDGRSATQSFGPLPNGARYFIGAKAYNVSAGLSSVPAFDSGQWNGPSSSTAAVLVGSAAVTTSAIVFNGIVLGPQTTDVRVFVREYASDPGTPVSVRAIGYTPPGSPMKANGSLTVPVAIPGNWIVATFVALDALNREGGTSGVGVGVSAGEVTVKVQSTTVAPAIPTPPTVVLAQNGGGSIDVKMTPASITNLSAFRIFRDGIALPDVPLTVGAGVQQTFNDAGLTPGSSHSYQVYGVNATGVLSATGSAPSSLTLSVTQIPLPTVSYGAYDEQMGGFYVSIIPGGGTPSGVTWVVYSRLNLGATSAAAESSTSTDFTHFRNSLVANQTDYVKVVGRKTGYTDSNFTAETGVLIPGTKYQ